MFSQILVKIKENKERIIKIIILIIIIFFLFKSILYEIECSVLFQSKKLDQDFDFNIDYNLKMINIPNTTLKEQNIKCNSDPDKTVNLIHFNNPNTKNCIIYAHGNGGTISSRMHKIHKLSSMASVVIFDYRGYGKSTGSSSEENTYDDCYTVWKYLIKDCNINPDSITLYGHSLGASVVAQLGQKLCNKPTLKPCSIIMEAGFCKLGNVVKDHLSNKLNYFISSEYNSKSYLEEINTKIPILISHSKEDRIIKYYHKDELLKSNKNASFYKLDGGHNNIVFNSSYLNTIKSFLFEK